MYGSWNIFQSREENQNKYISWSLGFLERLEFEIYEFRGNILEVMFPWEAWIWKIYFPARSWNSDNYWELPISMRLINLDSYFTRIKFRRVENLREKNGWVLKFNISRGVKSERVKYLELILHWEYINVYIHRGNLAHGV